MARQCGKVLVYKDVSVSSVAELVFHLSIPSIQHVLGQWPVLLAKWGWDRFCPGGQRNCVLKSMWPWLASLLLSGFQLRKSLGHSSVPCTLFQVLSLVLGHQALPPSQL